MLLDCRPILEWLGSSPPADKAPAVGDSVVLLAVSPEALQHFHPPYLLTSVRGRFRWAPDCQAPAASPTKSNTEEELRPWCSAVRRNSSDQLTFRWEGAWVGLTQSAECFKSGSREIRQKSERQAGKGFPRAEAPLLVGFGVERPRGWECGQPLGADSRSGLPAHRKGRRLLSYGEHSCRCVDLARASFSLGRGWLPGPRNW